LNVIRSGTRSQWLDLLGTDWLHEKPTLPLVKFGSELQIPHRELSVLTMRVQNNIFFTVQCSLVEFLFIYITPLPVEERSIVVACLCARVCGCLSVRGHIFGTARPIFTRYFVHVTYGRWSVHF